MQILMIACFLFVVSWVIIELREEDDDDVGVINADEILCMFKLALLRNFSSFLLAFEVGCLDCYK